MQVALNGESKISLFFIGNIMYISINGHTIRSNSKNGTKIPPIRIAKKKNDSKPIYASRIKITEPCELIYDSEQHILKCGARLVIEAPDGSVQILS